jgi:drug/metabolite transporter (DMT)-like permease
VALISGERPATLVLVGVALCLVAIALVSLEKRTTSAPGTARKGLLFAAIAGCGFGLFFVLAHHAGPGTGMWRVVRGGGGGGGGGGGAGGAPGARPPRGRVTLGMALCSGVLDAGGNALYLLASRAGDLTVAAVLTSLYPAVTVLLARLRYGETMRAVQKVGLVVAAVAVVLTAAG